MRPSVRAHLFALAYFAGAACIPCPPAPGPTEPRDERTILGKALANSQTPQVAEKACGERWERDTDGWHGCVCGLETWRCMAQGWCTDPAVPGFDLGEPRAEATKVPGLPNVSTAHLEVGCD